MNLLGVRKIIHLVKKIKKLEVDMKSYTSLKILEVHIKLCDFISFNCVLFHFIFNFVSLLVSLNQ